MAKYIVLILFIIIPFLSFAYDYYYPVDTCGLINLLDYKQDFLKVKNKLLQNPQKFSYINGILAKIMYALNDNPKLYEDLISKLVSYSYENNICNGTDKYVIISYVVYVLYEYYLNLNKQSSGLNKLLNILYNN